MGLEGPSMFAGAAIGSILQRRLARLFADAVRRVLLVAGATAGIAAIFKAPMTGVVFALEVPYRDELVMGNESVTPYQRSAEAPTAG